MTGEPTAIYKKKRPTPQTATVKYRRSILEPSVQETDHYTASADEADELHSADSVADHVGDACKRLASLRHSPW